MRRHSLKSVSTVQEMQGRLLSASQVGRSLGIDVSTVYRMASDGRLPARKVGRQWRFPVEAVQHEGRRAGLDPDVAFAAIRIAADLLGVMMVVTDLDGRPITPVAHPCPRFAAADGAAIKSCVEEWRATASGSDLGTHFRRSHLGFDCASAFIRSGDRLLGMVIAGGIADPEHPEDDLHVLTVEGRAQVLASLPRIASAVAERRTS